MTVAVVADPGEVTVPSAEDRDVGSDVGSDVGVGDVVVDVVVEVPQTDAGQSPQLAGRVSV